MTKTISILGSTGSIGRQTLDVVDQMQVRVVALTCGSSLERMTEQCKKYQPLLAVMGTEALAKQLRTALGDQKTEILWGKEGLMKAAAHPEADTVITAVVGMMGL